MAHFLDLVADELIVQNGANFVDVQVVLPSKRAGLFLRERISSKIDEAAWLPEIITIQDFIQAHASKPSVDKIDLIFLFYEIYKSHTKEPDAFSTYLNWAPTVISDFNDIDRYLVDSNQIFRNLKDVKELEGWDLEDWSFSAEALKPIQTKFLDFWTKLPTYYDSLNQALSEIGFMRDGMQYKDVAENMPSLIANLKDHSLYFVGLNALSASEYQIINGLKKAGIAQVMWDFSSDIQDNNIHEANFFMRKNLVQLGKGSVAFSKAEQVQDIQVYASPNAYSQSGIVNTILKKDDDKETAIIVCDESMIESLQLNLPDLDHGVNITTELPITRTTIHNFLDNLLVINLKQTRSKNASIYFKDLFDVLQHPAFGWLENKLNFKVAEIVRQIHQQNISYLNPDAVKLIFPKDYQFINQLFNCVTSVSDTPQFIALSIKLITMMKSDAPGDTLINEQLFHELNVQRQIQDILTRPKFEVDLIAFQQLMRFILNEHKLSFVGEPLNGVQIMGMLESRGLNFKKVIFLGANEGHLPDNSGIKSFIPYDLRSYFKLPGKKNKEAIHAYYFYRQLWRSEEIHIIYNADSSGQDAREASRYIKQLEHNNDYHLKIHVPALNNSSSRRLMRVKKDGYVKDALENYLHQGLSPSAMSKYLMCPLDFFHRYVVRLYEQDEIEEHIQDSTFGTIIHNCLEAFYISIGGLNRILKPEDYENLETKIEPVLQSEFEKVFYSDRVKKGRNKIAYKVCKHYVTSFLMHELRDIKFGNTIEVLAQELDLNKQLVLPDASWLKHVNIKGKIDRIERRNGEIRILDYKTGSESTVKLNSVEKAFVDQNLNKQLQLMIYAWLYWKETQQSDFSVGIIYTRTPSTQHFHINKLNMDVINQIEVALIGMVENMVDLKQDFTEKFSPLWQPILGYPQ